ncbi:hypothetical protein OG912_17070 [Streptomyces sp. NBC_00464]|uniref:hypothetical protein n=1 Tax=Streptomyces sp. NBC_00464 TaxID=2975751 RepID=UPI002E16C380
MNREAQRLVYSSRKWMHAAFVAFSDGPMSEDMAVHHAGVAAEHLLKAYLAHLHPALIVEAKDFNSVLHATGNGGLASAPKSQAKTIGLIEAHARVSSIMKMPVSRRELQPVADARNGVAHAAFHDPPQVNQVFTSCLRVIDSLLPSLPVLDSYWGPYEGLHDRLLDQRVEDARIRLEGNLARARRVFMERYGHFSDKDREMVIAAIATVGAAGAASDFERGAACPACASKGQLHGEPFVVDARDDIPASVVFTPFFFDCAVCELHLESEQLKQVGLGRDIPTEMTPAEYFGGDAELDEGYELGVDGPGEVEENSPPESPGRG